jgi:putative ATPase
VPNHLRDRHYPGAAQLGHGDGYKYAHDYENNYVKQQYLPDELVGKKYYNPTQNGYERKINAWLDFLNKEN